MTIFDRAHAALLYWVGEDPERRGFIIPPPVGRGRLRPRPDECRMRFWEGGWIVVSSRRSRRDAASDAVEHLIRIRAMGLTLSEHERRECDAMPG